MEESHAIGNNPPEPVCRKAKKFFSDSESVSNNDLRNRYLLHAAQCEWCKQSYFTDWRRRNSQRPLGQG